MPTQHYTRQNANSSTLYSVLIILFFSSSLIPSACSSHCLPFNANSNSHTSNFRNRGSTNGADGHYYYNTRSFYNPIYPIRFQNKQRDNQDYSPSSALFSNSYDNAINNPSSQNDQRDYNNYYNFGHDLGTSNDVRHHRRGSSGSSTHWSPRQYRPALRSGSSPLTINVDDFINGGADHTQAFNAAWNKACSSKQDVTLIVPKQKTYRLKPVTFNGPCRSDVTVQMSGTIEAPNDMSIFANSRENWIQFKNINNLVVQGGGTFNGNGQIWWKNSCKIDKSKPCKHAPTAVTFDGCNNLVVNNVMIQNAQQMHIIFQDCVNVGTNNLMISSPEQSPNTDGIHITGSQNVRISNSVIKAGDDCISIVSGSRNVIATDITCGPGHGISIGSLGEDHSNDQVSNVKVDRATFVGSTNGVRIKTWQGGAGYARNIIFQNLVMHNVDNPIIIDQNYCDQDTACSQQKSAVQVSNVLYRNIRGTSGTDVAIKFDCSRSYPCNDIHLQNVNLVSDNGSRNTIQAQCQNVGVHKEGMVSPDCEMT